VALAPKIRTALRTCVFLSVLPCVSLPLVAQDLSPRAYVITPIGSNVLNLTYSYLGGGLQFDGSVPITGATASISLPVFSYYHSFNFFSRFANVAVAIPYGVGNFNGTVFDAPRHAYRSGLLDSFVRISVNLKGGAAMEVATEGSCRSEPEDCGPNGTIRWHRAHQLGK